MYATRPNSSGPARIALWLTIAVVFGQAAVRAENVPASDAPPRLGESLSQRQADAVERALAAFFAAEDAPARAAALRGLAGLPTGLSQGDLRRIARAAPPAGARRLGPGLWRVALPWDPNASRGWFNLAIPPGYTPSKPAPLAICLHGSDSDGDNMVELIHAHLARAGWMAIYPTAGDPDRLWSAPPETTDVYRLISWAARRYRVDFRRLIVLGGSMGGMGAWSHVLARPDIWSAGGSSGGLPPSLAGASAGALRRVPFYVLHGSLDTDGASLAPVERVRQAVASLARRGIDVTYVEVPAAGHTPGDEHFARMAGWLASRPRRKTSPRGLFLPPPGRRAIWELWPAFCGLTDANDPALRAIQGGRPARAATSLSDRLAESGEGSARAKLLALRAVARVPGLAGPMPISHKAGRFAARDGWTEQRQAAALADLRRARQAGAGKGPWPGLFEASVCVMQARIHARRLAASLDEGDGLWARHYNAAIAACRGALRARRDHRPARRLLEAIRRRAGGR